MIFTSFIILFLTHRHCYVYKPFNRVTIVPSPMQRLINRCECDGSSRWCPMSQFEGHSWDLLMLKALSAEHDTMLIFSPFTGKPASEKKSRQTKIIVFQWIVLFVLIFFDSQCLTRNTILHYKTPKPKNIRTNEYLGIIFIHGAWTLYYQIFAGSLGRNFVGNWLVAIERTWRFIICFKFVWTQNSRQG